MRKGIWITLAVLIVAAAVIAGTVFLPTLNTEPVAVYSVGMISYSGEDGGMAESYGVVSADLVQTIYVSDTQRVTRIYVYDGQTVKKGELLYTYDTTLTDLTLERKDLSIQQMEINLKTAREDLKKLNAMKPMVVTTPPVSEAGKSPANVDKLGSVYDGAGTAAKPYLFWMTDGGAVTEDLVWDLLGMSAAGDVYVVFQSVTGDKPGTEFNREFGVRFTLVKQTPPATEPASTEPADPTEPTEEPEKTYTMRFFDPNANELGTQVDWNSGYTQSELNSMREQKSTEIRELEFSIKIGKAELQIMRKEASDGNVYAEFDGVVVSVLNPGSAETLNQPMIKLTGGGGYYVEGTVSEDEREIVQVGMKVTVQSWGTGNSYSGTVSWVGDYPVDAYETVSGQAGVTYYPYRVFVDDQANLQEGTYVSLICHTGEDRTSVMYLENAFIVTEGRDSFVYVRNAEGVLEKRQIKTGISIDGYATPVYSGLSANDHIAFPYGKNVREGAQCVVTGADGLYGW